MKTNMNVITSLLSVLVCPTIGVLYSDQFHIPDVIEHDENFELEDGNILMTSDSRHHYKRPPRFDVYEEFSLWGCRYKTCSGLYQSPITIDTKNFVINPHLTPLESPNYGMLLEKVVAKNVGYSVELVIPSSAAILVYGSGLKDTYKLKTVSFYWRNDSSRGSLHQVDGSHFPLEVVFTHRNVKYDTAVNTPDLEIRISAFGTVSNEDNEYLKPIVEVLHNIHLPDNKFTIKKPFSLREILPPDGDHYVRYKGSMPEPPCYEGVIWYILHQSISISENQLKEFRKLARNRPEDPKPRFKEYRTGREVQALNDRILESTPFVDEHNSESGEIKGAFY